MAPVSISHQLASPVAPRSVFGFPTAILLPLVWLRRLRQRRELAHLMGSPDYILKDVGLQRHQISREALKPFWVA